MALWPFNLRKRKGSRSADAETEAPNLGISTRITAQDPKYTRRDTKPSSKPHSRQPSRLRGRDMGAATPEANEPLEQSSADKSAALESNDEPENDRKPLSEVRNPVANVPTPAPLKDTPKNASYTSLQNERIESQPITPTLQHKRSRGPLDAQRQKSSKRRAEDKDRLQEIKSMSAPVPVPKRPRSVTHGPSPLAQESGKIRSGLNRNIERPLSEVSLPRAASFRSSFSGNLEMSSSYRVFDVLSPRPRIRHTDGPPHASDTFAPSRTSTKKEKGPAIPEEEDFSPRKRIDNLADDMDAGALRELMERDRRRKERKKRSKDKTKTKAERQKERAQRKKEEKGENSSNAVEHSEDVQMRDVGEAQPRDRRSPPPEPVASPSSWVHTPSRTSLEQKKSSEAEDDAQEDEKEELETEQDRREEARPDVPTHSSEPIELPADVPIELPASDDPSNLAMVTPTATPQKKTTTEETKESPSSTTRDSRRDSDVPSRWKSIFRRSATKHGGSSEKSRGTPSEFSNTSRESFARQQKEKAAVAAAATTNVAPPPPPPPPAAIPREPPARSASNTPKRTRSKFREDLPEFVSPPLSMHSRVNSMDSPISPISPLIESMVDPSVLSEWYPLNDDADTAQRGEPGLVRNHSQRSGTPDGQSAALLSQSLASVDSEGSWLSGRPPPKRSSLRVSKADGGDPIAGQAEEPHPQRPSEQDADYFARRNPTDGPLRNLQASGLTAQLTRGLQGADETESAVASIQQSPTDDQPKGGEVTGHQPTVVQSAEAHRSREGLVEMYLASEEATSPLGAEASPERRESTDPDASSVHEATSVDFNKGHHSRRVSAGSARILEIPGRDREKRNSGFSTASSVYSSGVPPRTDEEGQTHDGDLEGNKRHSAISVESTGNPSRTADLGLGLRLGRRLVSGRSMTPEPDTKDTKGA